MIKNDSQTQTLNSHKPAWRLFKNYDSMTFKSIAKLIDEWKPE